MWSINPPPEGRSPGAGDLLVDGLDAGIVSRPFFIFSLRKWSTDRSVDGLQIALALPLYRYRADLRKYVSLTRFLPLSLLVERVELETDSLSPSALSVLPHDVPHRCE